MKFSKEEIKKTMLLYAITDRQWLQGQTLREVTEEVLKNGATFLQIREKKLDRVAFLKEALELRKLANKYGVPFVVNDDVEIALAIDADGVHLGQSDLKDGKVRERLGPDRILGISANTVETARAAEEAGADYIGVGAVFATATKEDAKHLSLDQLKEICDSVNIPVVAIGGIQRGNIRELKGSGVDGIALISGIFAQEDPGKATRELVALAREAVFPGEVKETRSPAQRLYDAARPVWDQFLAHPFVTGIGDGSLGKEKFQYFLLQDYLYLFDYAKVFALGLVKAQDPRLMMFFSENVDAILHGEMKIHRAYMERMGISEEEVLAVKSALPNLSYTNYMLSVAHGGGTPEIIAAILACSWSYAEIGETLARIPGATEHPFYGEWIQGYISEEYTSTNRMLIDMMNRLGDGVSQETFDYLREIFVNCSRFELGFWDMAWEMQA